MEKILEILRVRIESEAEKVESIPDDIVAPLLHYDRLKRLIEMYNLFEDSISGVIIENENE